LIDNSANIPGSSYEWDFGDGNTSTQNVPIHTYSDSVGTFTVSVTVTSPDGCSTTELNASTVVVSAYPEADFELESSDTAMFTINFTDLSTGSNISNWYWDFGDDSTSTMQNPSHTYAGTGTYTIQLIVENIYGCTDTITKTLIWCSDMISSNDTIVLSLYPQAAFTADPSVTTTLTPTINFTDLSVIVDSMVVWSWDFGDGNISSIMNPSNTYSDSGTYIVGLTITNAYGCTDDYEIPIRIKPHYEVKIPNAFSPNPNGSNGGSYNPLALNNDILYPITRYVIDFHMRIYNRWGELIFESFDIDIGWDGYYRGRLSPQDVYVWKIMLQFGDGTVVQKAGDLTLVR
ncbi:MAG: hypothetical protein COB85_00555, partial [Bacteroidetes bacterium]